jgi:hypothetical protein
MPRMRKPPLDEREVAVLGWIADGCPDGLWPTHGHKVTARALVGRGLARAGRKGNGADKVWWAELTEPGWHYLHFGCYELPPDPGS